MNIVFFGSAAFAVPTLKRLLGSSHRIAAVVTQPDRRKGRGLELSRTPVKDAAHENRVRVYQPEDVNTQASGEFLRSLHPDLFVVIAYGQLLSQEVLDIPGTMAMNLHASLLPRLRGAAPINWAIINGSALTGVTVMKMVRAMDAGPVIAQAQAAIEAQDSAVSLEEKLSDLGAHLVAQALDAIERRAYELVPQDEAKVTHAPKLKKEDGRINWQSPAQAIYDRIRGTVPWPGAFTTYKGKLVKIYKAAFALPGPGSYNHVPGEVISVSAQGITVAAQNGSVVVQELQAESKRRVLAEEFVAGHRIVAGDSFGDK
jgi:methionyl-tRNA formyltransferase